ncbi:uncharacterized protein NECHADRAFT_91175 [Fusarium vanettenii 77-13-4]|uniref:Steroid 5-alpha reductase C-terminal domain-containing protein n=1 Tax=Fusarium vanettenii (strain ATCC MYA-4622 / CBS 123669 / FGSC 9596 / NRRL 45880 / 77-13-4) TaxID=660122 RepID=C7Z4S5_FUSV7|nr:uncharacterized protein NECHADRAFT_91175 [Fusarium vanettenii 77-13-4]EEU40973.1 hypothetical protein NECHADRAFT_91175 [Fusarium vanettenii 77-13-4]
MAESNKAGSKEFIQRDVKKSSPAGTLTFLGLRGLDPVLQYSLLTGGGAALLGNLGIPSISPDAVVHTGIQAIDALGLPLPHLIILAMAVGSAAKQGYWLVKLSEIYFPPTAAITVSVYNSFVNSVNTLLFVAAATSSTKAPAFPGTSIPYPLVVGPALYTVGIALEVVSEYQRKVFKDNPANKGKVMRTGLWNWARHINYGGYALWRGAYSFASSGPVAGLVMGGGQAWDFITRAVPSLNRYCSERYGEQWESFKKDVKWTVLPGIY